MADDAARQEAERLGRIALQNAPAHVSGKGILFQADDLHAMLTAAVEAGAAWQAAQPVVAQPVAETDEREALTAIVEGADRTGWIDRSAAFEVAGRVIAAGFRRSQPAPRTDDEVPPDMPPVPNLGYYTDRVPPTLDLGIADSRALDAIRAEVGRPGDRGVQVSVQRIRDTLTSVNR